MDVKISSAAIKLVSLNVRGVSNFKKRRTIFTWCPRRNVDVIFYRKRIQIKKRHSMET